MWVFPHSPKIPFLTIISPFKFNIQFLAALPLFLSLANHISIFQSLHTIHLVKLWWKYMPSDSWIQYFEK